MSKVQKSLLVNEDLLSLLETYQEFSGASFTKAVTAALIAYLFNGLEEPRPDNPIGPHFLWMKVASRLERGDVTVEDLPFELVDQFIGDGTLILNHQRKSGETVNEDLDKQVKSAQCLRTMMENAIVQFGGKRQAIVQMIENRFTWYK